MKPRKIGKQMITAHFKALLWYPIAKTKQQVNGPRIYSGYKHDTRRVVACRSRIVRKMFITTHALFIL
jgi:hypothetical protein